MSVLTLPSPLPLPSLLRAPMDAAYTALLQPEGPQRVDFRAPAGEAALVPPDSVSWRIFKNPVSLFIGGVAAVLLELAEPGVRTGVWEHSAFRRDPEQRLRRTGLAAMVTVYGARSTAEAMIAHVRHLHDKVAGQTPSGEAYRASDPGLLDWVQTTALFGFVTAYSDYASPLDGEAFDRLYREGQASARLYGAVNTPQSDAERVALFELKRDRLEASPIVFEFLNIMHHAKALPWVLRPLQPLLICAAVSLLPDWVRERLGLTDRYGLVGWEKMMVRQAGALADTVMLPSSPPAQACLRLGLPADYLYRKQLSSRPGAAG